MNNTYLDKIVNYSKKFVWLLNLESFQRIFILNYNFYIHIPVTVNNVKKKEKYKKKNLSVSLSIRVFR